MTFQEIILRLQAYWAEQGCITVQPWDVEKGAGTFNSATYLRALGPEPWKVAYVEPSRRPADARYGDNPNRVERHHQFQVLLKPSPKNVQELYLGSLRAVGVDPLEHDIRFVEDNWESPTLGAWGLGWEVWYDGMEITQFTYFQQCGGYDLDPISVELTYGLERIAMCVQNVENVYDLQWVGDFTYGDIRHAEEVQWSVHNFEQADIELHLRWFNEAMAECARLCDAGLPLPAYDYCLRCSHYFNILDARGAIGVTERQAYILRVRDVSKRCADAFLAHREALGFPLVRHAAAEPELPALPALVEPPTSVAAGPFLLELGTEEIPARLAPKAVQGLLSKLTQQLAAWGLEGASGPHADSTPRRLAIGFDSVPLRQPDRVEEIKGPPKRIAFKDGERTRAGDAFYNRLLEGDEVYEHETPKGTYLMARRRVAGRSVASLLAEALPRLIGKMHWPKAMRWGTEKTAFVRPVHWIVCALGGELVPFRFAGVASGRSSRGHRFHAPESFEATSWQALSDGLAERKVLLSSAERKQKIWSAVERLAAEQGGAPLTDEALLDEVTHIIEWPVPLVGRFEEELLALPRQAIVTPMRVHQRYFPIVGADGALLPCFVVIAGTEPTDGDPVARGNTRVLRARLADARFFYQKDLEKPLESYLPQLETRIWLAKLGSVRQKVGRLVAVVAAVGGDADAQRAALLSKADLATDMVGEFAELQGTMGREYARHHGETDEVSEALFEAYLPRSATDDLPRGLAGTLVALADRMDSIVGCFGIGLKPTGSKDPYALRRQSIAVINILTDTAHDIPLDLRAWIDAAIAGYGDAIDAGCGQDVLDFFADRTRYLHRNRLPTDVVDAVVAVGANRPKDVYGKIAAASAIRDAGQLEPILTTFKRVSNITRDVPDGGSALISAGLPSAEPADRALSAAYQTAVEAVASELSTRRFSRVVRIMAELRPLVDTFFDEVLVMADEPELRAQRLGLLCRIRSMFSAIADFTRIQDRK